MVRKILQATEPRGEAVLRKKANKVRAFDASLERLIEDMTDTMRAGKGVGLAAPQIGVLKRVVVVEVPLEEDKPPFLLALCNPEIVERSAEEQVGEEGCLSLAGWYGLVARASDVEVRYQDAAGRRRKLRAGGFLARVLQHEIDHLDGVLFTDRLVDPASLVQVTEEGEEPVPQEALLRLRRAAPDLTNGLAGARILGARE
ncbi:MAG: peptide deformylase [Chloroflexia bacterium]